MAVILRSQCRTGRVRDTQLDETSRSHEPDHPPEHIRTRGPLDKNQLHLQEKDPRSEPSQTRAGVATQKCKSKVVWKNRACKIFILMTFLEHTIDKSLCY